MRRPGVFTQLPLEVGREEVVAHLGEMCGCMGSQRCVASELASYRFTGLVVLIESMDDANPEGSRSVDVGVYDRSMAGGG